MANEVEIVVTGKNKAKPAVDAAKKDADGLAKKYEETSKRSTSALDHIRDALRHGLHDAIADVNGETNRIGRAFRAAQESVTASVDRMKTDVRARLRDMISEKDGRSAGARFAAGARSALMNGLKATSLKGVGNGFSKALQGALSTPLLGPIIVAALAVAAAGAAMTVANIIAGGIVLGLGAGLVGAGAAALFHVEEINKEWSKAEQKRVAESNKQAEKLRKQWTELSRDIVNGLKRAAQPLIPVLDTVRSTLRNVGREFEPVIKQGLQIAQGPLKRFVRDLGASFLELKPTIVPVMLAFGQLLDQIGPSLPGIFRSIAESIVELAGIVSDNRDIIASIFIGLLTAIPFVINLVGDLAGAFRGSLVLFMGLLDGILGVMQGVMGAIASMPGPWQESARAMAESLAGTRAELDGMRADVENFPRKVELEGNIRDLEGKIAAAKVKLRDPKLTRPERAKIRAEISDLQRKVAAAKSALASIKSRSVSVFINQIYRSSGVGVGTVLAPGRAHGGVIGGLGGVKRFAQGGVAGSGSSLAMVGEQGPELVRLPVGSSVTPAGQTRAMQQQGGFGSISMAFRQAGGDSGGGLAGSMRDLTKALREVVSLRDGMSRFTDGVMGQSRALIAYEAAWDNIRKSIKENGRSLNIGTAKGRENKEALLGLADAAHTVVSAMHDLNRPISTIVAKMKEQRAEFIKAARSFGLTSAQAKKLADYYGLIPSKVKSVLTKEKADLAYNKKAEKYNASLDGKASGGIAGGWTMVGERGAELVRLPFGSSVVSSGQSAAMVAAGGRAAPVVLELRSSGNAVDDMLLKILRGAIRTRGGNVQLVLGKGA
ncbi:hypothetical protein ABZ912_20030 [Nonomuraea angiospora]|uniref:hypothetical protein n=1 Tax=Nonomuraea angiospora TaxID=46172 RepID=UPI0033F7D9BF